MTENSRIHSIILYNAPEDKSYASVFQNMGFLLQVKRNILNEKHCGIINTEYFYSNINLLSESQTHNTCLNRKISIDKEGNIRCRKDQHGNPILYYDGLEAKGVKAIIEDIKKLINE